MRDRYRILIICGGGIFGYIPARLLAGTGVKRRGYKLADAMGGTSIGGILTLMLMYGYRPNEVLEKFKVLSERAFHKSWWRSLNPWGPKFNGEGLESSLYSLFSDHKLDHLTKPIIVPTVDFKHNKPKIFDNIVTDSDMDIELRALGRMTSAAPTYFPPKNGHIDGGLLANNPVLETVTAIKSKLGISFKNMDVLVIGTGHMPSVDRDMSKVSRWSSIKWLKPLLNYLTKANEMDSNFIARQIGLGSYTLFNPVVREEGWRMDDPSLIPELDKRTKEHQADFNKIFKKFIG